MSTIVILGPVNIKSNTLEAFIEFAGKSTTGLMLGVSLLIVWGSNDNISGIISFLFCLNIVFIIFASIIRPLSFVKKFNLTNSLALALSVMQGVAIGMIVACCSNNTIIGVLTTNLLPGGLPHPYNAAIGRCAAAIIIASSYNLSIPLRLSSLLAIWDIIFLLWQLCYTFKKTRDESNYWFI